MLTFQARPRIPARKNSSCSVLFYRTGNLTLYAHGLIRPGDSNTSNMPAVVYTLRTTNQKPDRTPLKLSFLVAGAAFRNDWRQVGSPLPAASSSYATRSACAAACSTSPDCRAWQFELANHSCFLDHSSYAQVRSRSTRFYFSSVSLVV
jgi:hypothetical protein